MGFQEDSYHAIERLTIEDRETKTTIIILTNQKKRKQRQSDHGESLYEQAALGAVKHFVPSGPD